MSFVLRRFTYDGVQMNQYLGAHYTVTHRNENPEEFRRLFKFYFEKPHVADGDTTADKDTKECYAFVGNGPVLQPLFKGQKSYVMTEGGKTFDNLSY